MSEGNVLPVGVLGRTLTDWWGLRPALLETDGELIEAEEVDEVLEWVCAW